MLKIENKRFFTLPALPNMIFLTFYNPLRLFFKKVCNFEQ